MSQMGQHLMALSIRTNFHSASREPRSAQGLQPGASIHSCHVTISTNMCRSQPVLASITCTAARCWAAEVCKLGKACIRLPLSCLPSLVPHPLLTCPS
jgi:hypothetical protein